MVDFDARYRFRKVISCRLHDLNLDLKFAKFCVKVGFRSRNLLKKVIPLTTFSWITLKFNVFCWDKYYFSESLGCKLIENYKGFKNILLFYQGIIKHSNEVRYLTCLETNFILILNFPQISAKYAPKYYKWTKFHEFKQFCTVGNRVEESQGGHSSRICFHIFYSIVNTPTKKKPHHETPCYPPHFRNLPSKWKL